MSNQASERLSRLNDKIMQTWEKRACEEVVAANYQDSLALRDSLPEFLVQIVKVLSTTVGLNQARVKSDNHENRRIGQKHGRERAGQVSYTIDQLILEYHILRQVICDIMEEEAPLSPIEREVIVCAVEQAVNDAATQFSESVRDVQEKFTQTLAHDLRGPITIARLSSQLIARKPTDSAHVLKAAKRINVSMGRLDLMLTDLLDAGKLRAGEKLKLDFIDCDLTKILQQVTDETNFVHDNRIVFDLSGPAIGHWNEEGLRRVFDNLITNALKFSDAGSPITLEIKQSVNKVEATVQNFGDLISKEDMSEFFENYKRGSTADDKKGWGLGLTVVKGLTEAHGGHVEVKSSTAEGTVFKVTLPWSPEEVSSNRV